MIPTKIQLRVPKLIETVCSLASNGRTAISLDKLLYLNVDDEYIHQLFPLLPQQSIRKPDYFDKGQIGAHISIIYPGENKLIGQEDINQTHHFEIKEIVIADIALKKFYVLLIESLSLLQLRRKYHLPDDLCFKGYSIPFHMTIAIEN